MRMFGSRQLGRCDRFLGIRVPPIFLLCLPLLVSMFRVMVQNGCRSASHLFCIPGSMEEGEGEADSCRLCRNVTHGLSPYWPGGHHMASHGCKGAWEVWSFMLGCPWQCGRVHPLTHKARVEMGGHQLSLP